MSDTADSPLALPVRCFFVVCYAARISSLDICQDLNHTVTHLICPLVNHAHVVSDLQAVLKLSHQCPDTRKFMFYLLASQPQYINMLLAWGMHAIRLTCHGNQERGNESTN